MTASEAAGAERVAEPPAEVPAARIVFSESDRAEIGRRVDEILRTGALTLGGNTRELEAGFAEAHEARFAIAVSSGTAALEIILRSLGVAGREVIVPANTFAATAFAVTAAGGRPVFADVSATTLALSVDTVTAALTERTAAVVLVHIGGFISPEVTGLAELCRQRGIALVEDAAHAHGSRHAGTPAGSFGVAGSFSFYPTKVITCGEGGLIVTADERIRDEALGYRDQGKAGFLNNLHTRQGYAWRMSELHAAVALVHLRRLPEFLAVRRRVAARYHEALAGLPGLTPVTPPPESYSNYYKYVALLAAGIDRAQLKAELRQRFGIALAGEVYETPLHQQPVFAELANGPLPVAEDVCARHVCLPVHSDMTDAEVDRVLAALGTVLGERAGATP
ncbi:MAG TPA: DegT/DnrJ/EryC1/StrS family aminotransferase [Jatrophihabitans sp.]|nr:DegT/DnrJ/EryC1/StrS family aminotransferase [Jatrophihabitans sp.]